MSQGIFGQSLLIAVFAIFVPCAGPSLAAECGVSPCVADVDVAGGVPDGNFASDAAARETPAPGKTVSETTPRINDEGSAGAAIFSPFAGAQEPEKRPSALASLFLNDGRGTAVAFALAAALVVTLVGVAVFAFMHRRSKP